MRRVLTPLPPRRQLAGWLIAAIGLPVITLALVWARDSVGLTTVLLLYLVLAMVVALVGGVFPAAVAVVGGFLLANWFFAPPYGQLDIAHAENALALSVYVLAAGIVAVLVDRIGRSRLRAARAQAEAETLAALVGTLSRPGRVARHARRAAHDVRAARRVAAARRRRSAGGCCSRRVRPSTIRPVPRGAASSATVSHWPSMANRRAPICECSMPSPRKSPPQRSEIDSSAEAAKADDLAAANALRASLLQAVSHDLRTPLASIKASISSLRQRDVEWPPDAVAEFEETIESETDRLTVLIDNLLDMSRLQASTVSVSRRPTGVEEVVLSAVASLGAAGRAVDVDVAPVSRCAADPALLERSLANVIANAVRFEPPGSRRPGDRRAGRGATSAD